MSTAALTVGSPLLKAAMSISTTAKTLSKRLSRMGLMDELQGSIEELAEYFMKKFPDKAHQNKMFAGAEEGTFRSHDDYKKFVHSFNREAERPLILLLHRQSLRQNLQRPRLSRHPVRALSQARDGANGPGTLTTYSTTSARSSASRPMRLTTNGRPDGTPAGRAEIHRPRLRLPISDPGQDP
jgi:hypothetical protein